MVGTSRPVCHVREVRLFGDGPGLGERSLADVLPMRSSRVPPRPPLTARAANESAFVLLAPCECSSAMESTLER
eukprot:scaffold119489_cov28-Tisochrysis_lutea.AAC.4